jgi:hypothetical protein
LSVVSVVCLSGRGLCDGLITRPEESYRLCCVIVCHLETRKGVVKASKRRRIISDVKKKQNSVEQILLNKMASVGEKAVLGTKISRLCVDNR